jgi:hypothetical protein
MATAAQIRNQIATKIFAPYSKTVTHQVAGSHTYSERGDVTTFTAASSSSIGIVPYDVTKNRETFEKFGNHNVGDLFAAVPYTVTISINDRIIMDSVTYQVMETIPHYLPDNLVTIVRLSKIVA